MATNQPAEETPQASSTDLFTNPPKPTGLPLGVDPAEVASRSEEDVTPEEQRDYDQVVRAAATMIYKNPKQTIQALNSRDKPVHEMVGRVAAKIAKLVEGSAQAAGKKISPDVMWHAGSEVIEMLMDLGVQAKVFPIDPESEEYQQTGAMALMEAEKIIGEEMLKDPKRRDLAVDEAGDVWAWNIAKEVDGGQASPQYMEMVDGFRKRNDPITGGVKRALGGEK